MPIQPSTYSAHKWLTNAHLQTVLASRVFVPPAIQTQRERLELPDGDFLDVNLGMRSDGDVVAIFHGLAGCVESSYVRGAFHSLQAEGFRPVLMHWRGCSNEPNRLARSYHSGASDDIGWFIDYLAARFNHSQIYALGFSLGGNALLKYLGEAGNRSPLSGAMAVSPPLVLQEGADKLNQGLARVYQRHLLSLMRKQHERKRIRYPALQLPQAPASLDTFWKFDDALTAPLHGYEDVHDYYKQCSARQYLQSITTATHILCSRDDPFFTPQILPDAHELSPSTILEVTEHGGHVGFLQGRTRWMDTHIARTLADFRHSAN